MGKTLCIQNAINVLGLNDFSLVFLLMEDGKFKRFGVVEDGHLPGRVFANSDPGVSQGISRAVGLDLINDLLELDGQVFGDDTGFLPGQDVSQIFKMS